MSFASKVLIRLEKERAPCASKSLSHKLHIINASFKTPTRQEQKKNIGNEAKQIICICF